MKVSSFLAILVILLLSTVFFPACCHWGYNGGPTYKKITTDHLRYMCIDNEFRLKKVPEKKASIYCYKENTLLYRRIVIHKDTLIQEGFLKLPDELIALTKANVVTVEIILDDKEYYDFRILKNSCVNDTISGSLRVY